MTYAVVTSCQSYRSVCGLLRPQQTALLRKVKVRCSKPTWQFENTPFVCCCWASVSTWTSKAVVLWRQSCGGGRTPLSSRWKSTLKVTGIIKWCKSRVLIMNTNVREFLLLKCRVYVRCIRQNESQPRTASGAAPNTKLRWNVIIFIFSNWTLRSNIDQNGTLSVYSFREKTAKLWKSDDVKPATTCLRWLTVHGQMSFFFIYLRCCKRRIIFLIFNHQI